MGWLFTIFVVGLVMYWLSKLGEKALSTESTPQKTEGSLRENLEGTPGQDDFEVTVSHQETPSGAIDLREDAKRLLRIVGSGQTSLGSINQVSFSFTESLIISMTKMLLPFMGESVNLAT